MTLLACCCDADITLLPPGFVAHGVEANGGIFNKPMSDGFTFSDVDTAMDGATVVMLNAGVRRPLSLTLTP